MDLCSDVIDLNRVAQARRKDRLKKGSLVFFNQEFNFSLNQNTQKPLKYSESPPMMSKKLVEEYMLLANILVAEFLQDRCKDRALVRAHANLKPEVQTELREFFDKVGIDRMNLTDAESLSMSIDQIAEEPNSEDKLMVINRKILTQLT
mmetsp:Transcript_19524/g.30004  ORF Transcript_19524/g.30004 Transcript_19524/m.30004 type:complete len:149 (+) Transcript_19524:4245-4691(+)